MNLLRESQIHINKDFIKYHAPLDVIFLLCYDIYINCRKGNHMKLRDFSEIKLGTIVTRLQKKPYEDSVKYPAISMKQVSSYDGINEYEDDSFFVEVPISQRNNVLVSKLNDIVIGLTSQRAMVIEKENTDKLVPSNFALIRINNDTIDPFYLCWQLNEGNASKSIRTEIQGTSVVRVLAIQSIHDINIELLPIIKQKQIGKLYQTFIRSNKIQNKLKNEKHKLIKQGLNRMIGEIKNED